MNHLHPSIQPLLKLNVNERTEAILKRRWIGYSRANQILNRMEDLLNHPKIHRMPNLLIKAETNNGKSFLLEKFIKGHPPYETEDDRIVVPIIAIEIPPEASPHTIYSLILDELQITYSYTAKIEVKTKLAFDGLERFQVKLIIIDELHVLMNTTKLKKAQMLDTLKYLGNRARISIVAAGTKEAHTAILSDNQLANRFEPLDLPQWKTNGEYRKLLATFEQLLPLKKPSNIQSQDLALEIYAMSGGWIGEIDALLKRAAIQAIKNKTEVITLESLRKLDWLAPELRRRL